MRSLLYLLARWLGDINAIQRGPEAIAKRIARKGLYRMWGSLINRILK